MSYKPLKRYSQAQIEFLKEKIHPLSRRWLAAETGILYTRISQWLGGHTTFCDEKLDRLCHCAKIVPQRWPEQKGDDHV